MQVHLVDGTYELFRHHFGQPALRRSDRPPAGPASPEPPRVSARAATRGVLATIIGMLADGATHVGVATDHVIESFRNRLWPGYKSGEGLPPELTSQFPLVETALEELGVRVWAMVELEADDALASAAAVAAADDTVDRVLICTPDKDLAQCVVGDRVVQLDRRSNTVMDEAAVTARFGVPPAAVADWLALVGDSADGFPGLPGWGPRSATVVLAEYGAIEDIPEKAVDWAPKVHAGVRGAPRLAATLAEQRERALLFKRLATLVVDRSLLTDVDDLRWTGPKPGFAEVCRGLDAAGLAERAAGLAGQRART